MNNQIRDFKYGLVSPLQSLMMVVVASAIPLVCANLANGDPNKLRLLGGLILLPPAIMWLLTAASALAALYTLAFAVSNFRAPKFVQLAAEYAVVPKASLFGGRLTVPYGEIKEVQYKDTSSRYKVIVIRSSVGDAKLLASYFNDQFEFDSFLLSLRARVGG